MDSWTYSPTRVKSPLPTITVPVKEHSEPLWDDWDEGLEDSDSEEDDCWEDEDFPEEDPEEEDREDEEE